MIELRLVMNKQTDRQTDTTTATTALAQRRADNKNVSNVRNTVTPGVVGLQTCVTAE